MGISWEQELRDTVNRNNNDLVEDPADTLPRPGRHRSAGHRDRRRGHRNTRNLGIRSTSGSVTLSSSPSSGGDGDAQGG